MGDISTVQATIGDIGGQIGMMWEVLKAPLLVPMLKVAVYICIVMELMLFIERLYMGIVIILVKVFMKKPDKRYKWEPMDDDDLEIGSGGFPKVLVQIPMFNEKEVYKISIGAACNLSWPSDRLVIQVLDDSTDPIVKDMVETECLRWASKGLNITYQIRETRGGYKAGALKEGLKHNYVKDCEYVVIFDADFRPEPDFLRRSIPFLIHNPKIALVQGRWRFVNANECLLTRMQEMSLDYHFTVEQEVGSSTHAFFGFNGTGGIWRIAAIDEAGGWKDRTTVEDMDLAVRASLKGWKFVYLGDLQVKSELPSTFKAFRFQQHRWSCGPANLFRKMVMEIVRNKVSCLSRTLQKCRHTPVVFFKSSQKYVAFGVSNVHSSQKCTIVGYVVWTLKKCCVTPLLDPIKIAENALFLEYSTLTVAKNALLWAYVSWTLQKCCNTPVGSFKSSQKLQYFWSIRHPVDKYVLLWAYVARILQRCRNTSVGSFKSSQKCTTFGVSDTHCGQKCATLDLCCSNFLKMSSHPCWILQK